MPRKKTNTRGKKFGRWTALEEFYSAVDYTWWTRVECDCGTIGVVRSGSLLQGISRSCGCYRLELASVHGYSKHRLYKIWAAMVDRCHNPENKAYHNYGGRGITVCPSWREGPGKFCRWGDRHWKEGLCIGRRDNSRGYSPQNCLVGTYQTNNNNRRGTPTVKFNGVYVSISDLARICNIDSRVLYGRIITLGWDVIKATTEPVREYRQREVAV